MASSVAGTLVFTGGSCNGNPCNDPESHSQPSNGNESGAAVVRADDPGGRDQAEQEHNGATSSEDPAQGSAPRPRPTGTTEDEDIHPATNSNSKSSSRPSAFTCNSAASLRLFWGLHHPHLVAAARLCERLYTACRHFSISIAFLAVQFSLLCYGLSLEGASREEIENGTFLEVLYLRFVFSVLFGLLGFGLLLHPNARVLVELGTQGASRLWTCGAQRLGRGRAAVIVNAVEDNNSGSASGDQVQVTAERAEGALGEDASFRSADSGASSLEGIDNDQGDTVSLSFVDVAEDTRNSSMVRAVPLAARKSHTLSDEKTPDPPEVVDAESRRAPAPNTKAASWKNKFHDLHDSHERSLAALLLALALLEFAVVFLAQDHGSSYDRHGKLNFLAYLVVVPFPLVLLLPITQPKKWRWKFAAFSLYALVVVVHCAVTLPQWVRLWPKGVGVDLDFSGSHSPPTASSECRVRETIPWVMAVPFRMNFLFSDTKCRQRREPSAAATGGAARFTLELRARENMLLIHLQPRTRSSNNAANNYNSSEQQQHDSGSTGTNSSSTRSTTSHFWRMRALALQRQLLSRHMRSECRTTLTAPIGSTQTAMFLLSKHGGETRTEYTVRVGRGETEGGAAVVDELESEPLLPLYVEEHNHVVYNSGANASSGQHLILDTSSRTTSSAQHTYHDTDTHSYFTASSTSSTHSAQLFANAENTTTALFVSVRKSWRSAGWENRTNRTGTGSGTSVTSSSTTLPHRSSSTATDEQLQQLQHHVALLEYALQDLQEEEDQRHFAIAHPRIGHGMFFKVFCDDPATVQYLVTQPTSPHFFKPFNHLPVLLLVIDAIGRAEAVRKLPKTFSLLKQMHERTSDFRSSDDAADADTSNGNTSLTAPAPSSSLHFLYDFVRHSSTGFATYQNVAGMFYGSTAYDLHRCNAFWTYSSGSKLISPQMNETDWLRKRLNDPAVGTFQHGATHPTMGTGITSSSAEEAPVTLRYMGDLGVDVAELISPWVERDLWDPDNPFDILNGGPYSATVRCLGGRFSHAWQLDSASLNGRQENDAKRLTSLSNSNTSTSGTSSSSNATSAGSHQTEQIVNLNASEVSETPSRPFDRIAAYLFAATATAEDVHVDENMNVQHQGRFAVAIHWFLEAHEVTRAVVETMDDDLHAFFVQAQSSGLLNSTAVFLVSDHGNHLGAYPAVFDNGFVEMSNPMLLMSLPRWWVERFSVARNLLRNRQEFSTHFDLYETLVDIVRAPLNATELVPQLWWADGFSSAHGRSLLRSRVSANAGTPWANMPGLDPDRVSPRPDLRTLRKTCMCEQCELFEI